MKIIKINYLTYYMFILFLLTGYIKNVFIIFSIVIIHELGHFFLSKLCKYKVKEINIYPFGGITKINKDLNSNLLKDFFLAIGGFLFQGIYLFVVFLLFNFGFIRESTYELFILYNSFIFIFNLLPIYPLDGYNIVNIFFNNFFSFQKSYYLSFILSILFLIILMVYNINTTLNNIMIFTFLLFKIMSYYKNRKHIFNKFLLERHLNNYTFKTIVNTKNSNLKDLKINNFFYFWNSDKWSSEKKELKNKYKL